MNGVPGVKDERRVGHNARIIETGVIGQNHSEIRPAEQRKVLGEIVKHVAENVVVIHIFYDVVPQLMNKRVMNVTPRSTLSQAWNAHHWDVKVP